MFNRDWIEIDYDELVRQTDKAMLFIIEGDEYWLPKKEIEADAADQTIYLPRWLAKEKGLY